METRTREHVKCIIITEVHIIFIVSTPGSVLTGIPDVNVIIIFGQIITVDVGGNVVSELDVLDRQCDNVVRGR